jgi:hypothetical protein
MITLRSMFSEAETGDAVFCVAHLNGGSLF